ncbi:amino acid adenylation domain-containing protein [Sodalis sp. RH15]|uniref:amino acid adenylation domain-containing protein n=1 Tax=Sodalis sp. RH15 TaxID=3394330 RepID=UPI0039B4D143
MNNSLTASNPTTKDFSSAALITLFLDYADRYPEYPAIITGEERISYDELAKRAKQLAHYLLQLGVKDETPVGILFNAGIEQIICQVAVLLAGGTCVPLNVSAPDERLNFMLAEVEVRFTFADAFTATRALHTQFISLDAGQPLAPVNVELPGVKMKPDHRTHIFFTSGSTGRPKAVEVEARGIMRLVVNTCYLDLSIDDRFGNISSPDFDASLLEIWGALLNGAAIVIIPRHILLDPDMLADLMFCNNVSILMITPSLFNFIVSQCPTAFRTLNYLMIGGEMFNLKAYGLLPAIERPKHIYHVYGTTEDTTFTLYHPIVADDINTGNVPIGQPIDNTYIFILDDRLQPTSEGVIGEICIGGDGLSRGYYNQPDLTAEKFIYVKLNGDSNARRLYKTGDLGWKKANGDFMFTGRKNNIIKLQGYRIEAEEIEVQLMDSGMLQAAIVCGIHQDGEEGYLMAFIVPKAAENFSVSQLMNELKQRLPDYMLPRLQIVDRIPLTSSGKADRLYLIEQSRIAR